ncbi:hypothetical protein F4678DRAFT_223134 [Xylaria arbuscula]|nr:hypothetical protein F4678DRAFT_223134 [Xylaria arbuscula]
MDCPDTHLAKHAVAVPNFSMQPTLVSLLKLFCFFVTPSTIPLPKMQFEQDWQQLYEVDEFDRSFGQTDWLGHFATNDALIDESLAGYFDNTNLIINPSALNNDVVSHLGIVSNEVTANSHIDAISDMHLADYPTNPPGVDTPLGDIFPADVSLANIHIDVSFGDIVTDTLSDVPLVNSPTNAFADAGISEPDVAVADISPVNSKHSLIPPKPKKRCIRCSYQRRRCVPFTLSICTECARSRLPQTLCIQVRFSDEPIFQKWTHPDYQSRLQWKELQWMGYRFPLNVYHYATGPALLVNCRQFIPSDNDQTMLWGKSRRGWKSVQTGAVGLDLAPSDTDIGEYVSKCVPHCIQEVQQSSLFDAVLRDKAHGGLLSDALRLWTATHLLTKIWGAAEATPITDPDSPYFNMKPAARVLQNELDLKLESYASELELKLLNTLQTAMGKRNSEWTEIFSAILVLLAVMERDIWRLMYWIRHREQAYKWRHPDSAQRLIERSIFYVNLLMTHLRLAGDVPEHFRTIGSQTIKATSSYCEVDDSSLDGAFTRLAMISSYDAQLVKEADFC